MSVNKNPVIEPECLVQDIKKYIKRGFNADEIQLFLNRIALAVYVDMGLVDYDTYQQTSIADTVKVLTSIPDLSEEQQDVFASTMIDFVIDSDELFSCLPPMTLAKAYSVLQKQIDGVLEQDNPLCIKFNKVRQRMWQLSDNLSYKTKNCHLDLKNIPDVYDGYMFMLTVLQDELSLDSENDKIKLKRVLENKKNLVSFISEYDKKWGVEFLSAEDATELSYRWDILTKTIEHLKPNENLLELAKKVDFLDKDGKKRKQFLDENKNPDDNGRLNPNAELAQVIELSRHDVMMQNLVVSKYDVEEEVLQEQLDEAFINKLFELDNADKIIQQGFEKPEQFENKKSLNDFICKLKTLGGSVSSAAFQKVKDEHVNKTAGFLGRVKSKLGGSVKKVGNFFSKAFGPIEKTDKIVQNCVEKEHVDKRQVKINFFKRLLSGFGSAFLYGTAMTVVATAAATLAGIGIATSVATVGVITGIVVAVAQINKWKQEQEKNGKPADFETFIQQGRLLASLGTSALAAVGLVFGALALPKAAAVLGFGALALGSGTNAVATYQDAIKSGLSKTESIAWSVANVLSVLLGAGCGRGVANGIINGVNNLNAENTVFQNQVVVDEVEQERVQKTTKVYTQQSLDNARNICEYWYSDNPELLQQRVDMINEYNVKNSVNVDPYRAIMINADAGNIVPSNHPQYVDGGTIKYSNGNYNVINTDVWLSERGFASEDGNIVKNMFADNKIDANEIDLIQKMDQMISDKNEVGKVAGRTQPVYDAGMNFNSVDEFGNPVYDTYANGNSAFKTEVVTTVKETVFQTQHYEKATVNYGAGMFGVYNKSEKKCCEKDDVLIDRVGALADELYDGELPVQKKELPFSLIDEKMERYAKKNRSREKQNEKERNNKNKRRLIARKFNQFKQNILNGVVETKEL